MRRIESEMKSQSSLSKHLLCAECVICLQMQKKLPRIKIERTQTHTNTHTYRAATFATKTNKFVVNLSNSGDCLLIPAFLRTHTNTAMNERTLFIAATMKKN